MLYGDDKPLEMARSILPSTARRMAREDKRYVHSRRRQAVRDELHFYEGQRVEDVVEVEPEEVAPPKVGRRRSKAESDVMYNRFERRAADKLAHFERWAQRITEGVPVEEQMDYMRRLLPDNGIIGAHAMSHLRSVIGPDAWRGDRFHEEFKRQRKRKASLHQSIRDRTRNALMKILQTGQHKAFNDRINGQVIIGYKHERVAPDPGDWRPYRYVRTPVYGRASRPFYGQHDIDDFIAQLDKGAGDILTILEEMTDYRILPKGWNTYRRVYLGVFG